MPLKYRQPSSRGRGMTVSIHSKESSTRDLRDFDMFSMYSWSENEIFHSSMLIGDMMMTQRMKTRKSLTKLWTIEDDKVYTSKVLLFSIFFKISRANLFHSKISTAKDVFWERSWEDAVWVSLFEHLWKRFKVWVSESLSSLNCIRHRYGTVPPCSPKTFFRS